MYEKLAKYVFVETAEFFEGSLYCTPFTFVFTEVMKHRKIPTVPLVARAVVFNPQAAKHIGQEKLGAADQDWLCTTATETPSANGALVFSDDEKASEVSSVHELPAESDGKQTYPYRTIGYPHGSGYPLGHFNAERWVGHLVAVVEDRLLVDLTIGQLNDQHFQIHFDPPFLCADTTTEFLKGSTWLPVKRNSSLIYYKAFPEELSFEEPCQTYREKLGEVIERVLFLIRKKSNSELH